MANICDFDMLVRGKPDDVDTFYRYLTDYDNSPKYFARIFTAEIDNESVSAEGIKTQRFSEIVLGAFIRVCVREIIHITTMTQSKN